MICGVAIGKCNIISQVITDKIFWIEDTTLEEMWELIRKLEQIENETKE
jgi:hypothetical protein